MIWDEVMVRVRALLLADPTIAEIFGDAYRLGGTGDQTVPLLEWHLLTDTEDELWSPMLIQFDIWTRSAADARRAELRIRSLLHQDLYFQLGGDITMQSQYSDGSMLATPDRANFVGRGIRFVMTPLRRQYAGIDG